MAREPFQILVLVFRRTDTGDDPSAEPGIEYAVLRRADTGAWQGVAGGGEAGESPAQAARREAHEELATPATAPLYPLQTRASIPVRFFADRHHWPPGLYVIPEHTFALDATDLDLVLSHEHGELRWLGYQHAADLLRWDSNKTALWELHQRLHNDDLPPTD